MAKKNKDSQKYDAFSGYLESIKAAIKARKELADAENGKTGETGNAEGIKIKNIENRKNIEKLQSMREKYQEQIWGYGFDSSTKKQQANMLEADLAHYKDEIKKYPERIEKDTSEKNMKNIKRRYEILEKIAELEEKIRKKNLEASKEENSKLEERANKAYQILEQRQSSDNFFRNEVLNSTGKFRDMTQSSIQSNSAEALRLQSRMFINGGASQAQSPVQKIQVVASEIKKILDNLKQSDDTKKSDINTIKNTLANLGTSTAG